MTTATHRSVATGIAPFDDRSGGLDNGGVYLLVGRPGPAKMVTALQFVAEGIGNGERCLLITNAEVGDILEVAGAWGFDLTAAWEEGALQVIGFRDDFSLRAIRSIEPEEVVEELAGLMDGEPDRIAVDPGSLFLTGGARTLLGTAFVSWAKQHPATVVVTFSVDGDATELPSAADWLINATTGRLIVERRTDTLHQITLLRSLPGATDESAVTLELRPGAGLVKPGALPSRRGEDRGGVDPRRLLLVTLDPEAAADVVAWAKHSFETEAVAEPLDAVTRVQTDASLGCVLVHGPRRAVRDAVRACRALRPLTRAAIVFATDDAIRSTDRVGLLEAGADDCLSSVIDFRELQIRIRQAIESGAKPPPTEDPPPVRAPIGSPDGAEVSRQALRDEIDRRAADPDLAFFCLLDVRSGGRKRANTAMQGHIAGVVRSEDGDLVAAYDKGCLALLQGARESKLSGFIDRLRTGLEEADIGKGADTEIHVLSHPAGADAISRLLGTVVGDTD